MYSQSFQCILVAEMIGVRDVLCEGLQMKRFNHERILKFICISFDENSVPLIITPYMVNGNIRSYVRNKENVCLFI
jgi:hypothetical protein